MVDFGLLVFLSKEGSVNRGQAGVEIGEGTLAVPLLGRQLSQSREELGLVRFRHIRN